MIKLYWYFPKKYRKHIIKDWSINLHTCGCKSFWLGPIAIQYKIKGCIAWEEDNDQT